MSTLGLTDSLNGSTWSSNHLLGSGSRGRRTEGPDQGDTPKRTIQGFPVSETDSPLFSNRTHPPRPARTRVSTVVPLRVPPPVASGLRPAGLQPEGKSSPVLRTVVESTLYPLHGRHLLCPTPFPPQTRPEGQPTRPPVSGSGSLDVPTPGPGPVPTQSGVGTESGSGGTRGRRSGRDRRTG